jgi:hypothetical protein
MCVFIRRSASFLASPYLVICVWGRAQAATPSLMAPHPVSPAPNTAGTSLLEIIECKCTV